MANPPSGTVTFLFTDIEGSTKLWEQHPEAMPYALARHDALLREAIDRNNGYIFKTIGDASCSAFPTAIDALRAVVAAQRALLSASWGETGQVRIRAGLHTGAAQEQNGDYFGPTLNRTARLMSAAHGTQTVVSLASYELLHDQLPTQVELLDLGEHRLKDLIRPEHVFQVAAPDLPSTFPPLKTLDNHPNNLPAQPTLFLGREAQMAVVQKFLLQDNIRLLTLTGPGGVGKTRLALQVSANLIDRFADGIFLVRLTPISDPKLVVYAIAHTFNVVESAGQQLIDRLRSYVQDKQLLLILDNFEHVTEAAHVVSELLNTPGVKVLVTSRSVLGMYGEHHFEVPPLALPDAKSIPQVEQLTHYEAIQLFTERAQAVNPDFAVTAKNAQALVQICHKLDGLPLAIELAAARIRILSPQDMLERLSSRLKLLTGGARDLPARQQTLRNTIEWSYHLLDSEEQRLFSRLAVFVGSWRLEAAEAVCNADNDLGIEVLDGVASLVDKSLLRQQGGDDELYFRLLQTIREYALERLAELGKEASLRHRHAEYYLQLAEEAGPEWRGPHQEMWLARLETKHDNFRVALAWSLEHEEVEWARRLTGALWRFWWARGYLGEGRRWIEAVLERIAGYEMLPANPLSKVLYGAGMLAQNQGDYTQARMFYEDSLALARGINETRGIASALNGFGFLMAHQGDYEGATTMLDESLALFTILGDNQGIASALNNLGLIACYRGDNDKAKVLLETSLALRRELRDKRGIAFALGSLGLLASYQGEYDQATLLLKESLALYQELHDTWGIASSLDQLGWAALCQADHERATAMLKESLALFRELGDKEVIADCLEGLAGAIGANQPLNSAAKLFGAAEALRETIGAPRTPADHPRYEHALASVRAQLGETIFEEAWAEGGTMSIEQAIEYALQEN